MINDVGEKANVFRFSFEAVCLMSFPLSVFSLSFPFGQMHCNFVFHILNNFDYYWKMFSSILSILHVRQSNLNE